jgi:acyl-CoA thioesterase I
VWLFISLLVSCGQPDSSLTFLAEDAVILAFGDSLTYGTGASPGNRYPDILSELCGRSVINAGIPGEISQQGLARLPDLLDQHEPDLLILIHGGNDILRKISSSVTADNIRQMVAEARLRNIQVIMLGVPQPGLWLMSSAEIYRQIAENQTVVADLDTLPDILGSRRLKSDMIHPNDEGYRVLAENIYRLLQEKGAL